MSAVGRSATVSWSSVVAASKRANCPVGASPFELSSGTTAGELRNDRHEPVQRGDVALEQAVAAALAHQRAQHLRPRPVGGRPAFLPTTPPDDREAACARLVAEGASEVGLADAGFTFEEEQLAAPVGDGIERGDHRVQLASATDQRRARPEGCDRCPGGSR